MVRLCSVNSIGRADQRAPIHHWSLLFLRFFTNLSSFPFGPRHPLIILISCLPISFPRHLVQIWQYSNTIWTWGAIECGESPLIRTKFQRIPLSDSFAHPITLRYYIQKFTIYQEEKDKKKKEKKDEDHRLEIADEFRWKSSASRTRLCALNARKNFPLKYF